MKNQECPNCFRKTWNGKKCTSCGATSTEITKTDDSKELPNRRVR